jgi:cytochrome c oxidase subunit 2
MGVLQLHALGTWGGPQSALVTAGRDAAQIADLYNVMTVGALITWALVVAIAIYAIRAREPHSPRAANLLIIGGGVAAPTVVLGALIAYGMPLVPTLLTPGPAGASDRLSIQVTAKQWW